MLHHGQRLDLLRTERDQTGAVVVLYVASDRPQLPRDVHRLHHVGELQILRQVGPVRILQRLAGMLDEAVPIVIGVDRLGHPLDVPDHRVRDGAMLRAPDPLQQEVGGAVARAGDPDVRTQVVQIQQPPQQRQLVPRVSFADLPVRRAVVDGYRAVLERDAATVRIHGRAGPDPVLLPVPILQLVAQDEKVRQRERPQAHRSESVREDPAVEVVQQDRCRRIHDLPVEASRIGLRHSHRSRHGPDEDQHAVEAVVYETPGTHGPVETFHRIVHGVRVQSQSLRYPVGDQLQRIGSRAASGQPGQDIHTVDVDRRPEPARVLGRCAALHRLDEHLDLVRRDLDRISDVVEQRCVPPCVEEALVLVAERARRPVVQEGPPEPPVVGVYLQPQQEDVDGMDEMVAVVLREGGCALLVGPHDIHQAHKGPPLGIGPAVDLREYIIDASRGVFRFAPAELDQGLLQIIVESHGDLCLLQSERLEELFDRLLAFHHPASPSPTGGDRIASDVAFNCFIGPIRPGPG